jgi:HSP20 family molecular chaperone IbpA|tara:strand:+ start:96 stop:548 length:453 start_codon:yes stop_codon:yes gene_type:complete
MSTLPEVLQNSIHLLETNLNTSFAEQLGDMLNNNGSGEFLWRPPVDVFETETHVKIFSNVAGISADDINVDFFNNLVVITGERKYPTIDDTITQRQREIIYGKFKRNINLPLSITNRDSVSVNIKEGVLSIVINKALENANRFSVRPSSD